MKRYTINLSRARATSRKDRARKAVKILREELERKEGEVTLSREINQEIWSNGATKPPSKVSVKIEEEGEEKKVYPAGEKDRKRNASTSGSSRSNYDEIVSGTISEAKEAVSDLEDPNYDELLEAEENNKDRKTLKEWIQNQE